MLFGNESIAHYNKSNILIWMLMAFQAGLLNIGGFMAGRRFVSHITGFATIFGYDFSQGSFEHALGMGVVPLFFLLGVMLSGFLVDLRLRLQKKPKYYIAFGVIFFLTLFVAIAGIMGRMGTFGQPVEVSQDYTLLIFLCFICGIQNGTITTVSRSVIRTTHLTGITTDLGIGLVRLFNLRKIADHFENEKKASFMRLGIIGFFGMGSVVGGYAFHRFGHGGFWIPVFTSGVLFWTMMYYQVWKVPASQSNQQKT